MKKHLFPSTGNNESYWYEIDNQTDLQKYIDYASALAHSEFRAMVHMDDRGLTHNRWKSPITNLCIRLRGMGKSMMVLFAENETAYFSQMKRGLEEYGVIFISANGGYNFGIDLSDAYETIEIDKIEANLINIRSMTNNLILENDSEIDEELLSYMEENDIPFSSIIQLRLAIQNGDLMKAISYIIDSNSKLGEGYPVNIYAKTTAIDIEQIWDLLDKISKYIGEIHVMIPSEAEDLFESLKTEYPEIKFFRIEHKI